MFYNTRYQLKNTWFKYKCRDIFKTPPIRAGKSGLAIQTLTSHRDLTMALISIKSLYHHLNQGEIYVLDDGTLTKKDKSILNHHLNPVQIVNIADIDTGRCPRGGTWERLVFSSELAQEKYVFQVDSDTITRRPIPEIVSCIENNISFAPCDSAETGIKKMAVFYRNSRNINSDHINLLAEKKFGRLGNYSDTNYVRACSGYTGFARQSFGKGDIEEFSTEMEGILGQKWHDWGSEQICSNYIIANSKESLILPFSKYTLFNPERNADKAAYIHFYGTFRFSGGKYIQYANEIINQLKNPPQTDPG